MYLPSRFTDEGRLEHLMYFQDVSGSITESNIVRFNSELKYVWDTFKPQKMTIVQFDTRITQVDEFTEGDPFEKIKIVGRGGTCLKCVREKIIKDEPTAAIIFSDMQVAPMQKVDIPVLWVCVDSGWGIGHTPTFGKVIRIKDK
jgi:predicted metal-dependent peptidase